MIRLMVPGGSERYPSDIDRIVHVCNQAGYEVDRHTAKWAWSAESEDYAASWLFLPDDDGELLERVLSHLEANNEPT